MTSRTHSIRLAEIAHARSGDKGAGANVGVIAYTPAGYEFLRDTLSAAVVEKFFKPLGVGTVVRYELPNLGALNFLLPNILDGGGSVSLQVDAQGKGLAQRLLDLKLEVPETLLPELVRRHSRVRNHRCAAHAGPEVLRRPGFSALDPGRRSTSGPAWAENCDSETLLETA